MSEASLARRAMALIDLTDLSEHASDQATDALAARAFAAGVAAVCVWPSFVSRARDRLEGSGIAIATVINFPSGGENVERAVDDAVEAMRDGADEIDLVVPWRAFLAGRERALTDTVAALRSVVDHGRILKAILETGELGSADRIAAASRLAIEAGADFLKTSTGTTAASATPEAVRTMLDAIRESGRPVGIKPSGSIRTLAQAASYLDLADRIMGPGWVSPKTFRFGASGLLDACLAEGAPDQA